MISKHEVRLGSRISYQGAYVEITAIGEQPVLIFADGKPAKEEITWADLQPLPIDANLLKRLGFEEEQLDETICFRRGVVTIIQRGEAFSWQNPSDYTVNCTIRHLHQLQNLYNVLTGDELLPIAASSPFAKYRTGNMVVFKGQTGVLESIKAGEATWQTEAGTEVISLDEVEDLPATATELSGLGLIDNQKITGHHGLLQIRRNKEAVSLYTIYGGLIRQDIRSVSEFQNLYYALTVEAQG